MVILPDETLQGAQLMLWGVKLAKQYGIAVIPIALGLSMFSMLWKFVLKGDLRR